MKIKMTVIAAIPALMLVFAGYAQEPSASPKAKAKPDAARRDRGRSNYRNVEGDSG